MPHVMNETEILEQLARSLETDTTELQTSVLPASRRGPSLWGGVAAMLKLPLRRQKHLTLPCHSQGEMPLDILAREHPYLYMRAMIG